MLAVLLPQANRLKQRRWFSLAQQQPRIATRSCLFVVGVPHSIALAEGLLPTLPTLSTENISSTVSSSPPLQMNLSPGLGIVISKKVSKQAVRRNHLRRQIREIFRREVLPALAAEPTHTLHTYAGLVVIVRPHAVQATFHQLRQQLLSALQLSEQLIHSHVFSA